MLAMSRRKAIVTIGASGALPGMMLMAGYARAQTPVGSRIGLDTYVTQTLQLGRAAIEASQLALERSQNPAVREFAELEIAEQQAVAAVLAAAEAADAKAPAEGAAQRERTDRLAGTREGEDFDLAYVETQIEAHQELLEVQRTVSGEQPELSIETIVARLAEPAIHSHIAMLGQIQQLMGHERIDAVENEEADAGQAPSGEE